MCVFHSWQNMQGTNYTARIPELKRHFFCEILSGSHYVTLFCHYAISLHVLCLHIIILYLVLACLLYLVLVLFFFSLMDMPRTGKSTFK